LHCQASSFNVYIVPLEQKILEHLKGGFNMTHPIIKSQVTGLATVLSLAGVVMGASVVLASDDVTCDSIIGPVNTASVIVPDGETCTLEGTQVQGDVTVKSGATLISNGAGVENNIQGEGAKNITLQPGTDVEGNVQLQRGQQGGKIIIEQAEIDGELQLQDNLSSISVSNSNIGGNLQVKNNDGGVELLSNNIGNDLQCQDNDPSPTGFGNVAAQKQGQCEGI
jgi:hypothetical protein